MMTDTINRIRETLVENHIRTRLSEADWLAEAYIGTPVMLRFIFAMRRKNYKAAFEIYEAMLRGSLSMIYEAEAEREYVKRSLQ